MDNFLREIEGQFPAKVLLLLYLLAGRNLKLFLLQKCFVIYRQVFLTFIASKGFKFSFTSEIAY